MTSLTDVDLAELTSAFGRLLHNAGVPVTPERTGRFAHASPRPVLAPSRSSTGRAASRSSPAAARSRCSIASSARCSGASPMSPTAAGTPMSRPHRTPVPVPIDGRAPASATRSRHPHHRHRTRRPTTTTAGPARCWRSPAPRSGCIRRTSRQWSPEELTSLRSLIAKLHVLMPVRPSRRHVRSRAGERLDLRATLRRSHRTGGDPVVHLRRRRKARPRRVVLIADISGSMEAYSRAYLHLLHGAVRATRAEAFVFATRLTRLTRDLQWTNPDQALQRAGCRRARLVGRHPDRPGAARVQ